MIKGNEIYSFLVRNEGFYMKQYKEENWNKENWICIKDINGFLYSVIITNDNNRITEIEEADNYMSKLGKRYSLNVVILTDNTYIEEDTKNINQLVYSLINKEVIRCDKGCEPLKNIISLIEKNKKDRKLGINIKKHLATKILIGINVLIFLMTVFLSQSILYINTNVLVECGAKVNVLIDNGEIWRVITSAFLHGGLLHLLVNMYSLYILGGMIEEIFGIKKYLILYFISSVTSSLLSYMLDPNSISVGASGAIFGLLGAELIYAIKEKENIGKGVVANIVAVIILNLYIGSTIPNIDNFAHIGGGIGGIVTSLVLYNKKLGRNL